MNAALPEVLAQQRKRMAPEREPHRRVVAHDVVAFGRLGEKRGLNGNRGQREASGFIHGERLPKRSAAMSGEACQCIGGGQRTQVTSVQTGAPG